MTELFAGKAAAEHKELLAKLERIGRAGAEVDPEGRAWLAGQQPGEDEVLAGLRAWLSADADAADRAEAEAV